MRYIKAFVLVWICLFSRCTDAQKKSSHYTYEITKDSLKVFANNPLVCPTFFKLINNENSSTQIIDLKGLEKKQILSFASDKMDSISVEKKYDFTNLYYGKSNITSYDTLYNYGLPFLKQKRYKVLQGQNTQFTHKGDFSRYAIDFKMNIGQTVCAIREGVVVKVIDNYKEGGKSKKYRPYANLIIIYHSDGTFAQYVHLKHKGSLVKVGDTVQKGEAIAYSGNTGMSTQPHLHFAVYKPTQNGLVSIPFLLNSIPTKRYTKGKYATNN